MAVAAVLAGGLPASASAAGLGRLTVESGLGQPLNAVVEVTSLSPDELSSLTARLAAPEAFRRVGIEMSPALGSLRFAVEERTGRNPIVRITSEQPINEPFVDLLVELNWAAGRFVREYTFLLDPPELQFARESVEGKTVMSQLATPVVASTAAVPVAQRVGQAQGGSAGTAASASTAASAARGSQPAAASASRASAASRQLVAQTGTTSDAGQPGGFASGSAAPAEVTVQRGDTLAAIAERVKPADIAVEQAIVSIYEANPRAFFGSVHQLRAGRTLSIPDRASMEAVDPTQARRQIRMQAADFNAYRERLAQATRKVDVAETGTSASGAITARVDESGAAPAAGDQLRLSRSAPGEGGDTAGSATGTQGGQASAEALIASEAALREQTERVSLLEKNIADLQRLLELKNQQLAQMQLQAQLQSEATQAGVSGAGAAGEVAGSTGKIAGATGAVGGLADAAAPGTGGSGTSPQAAASDIVVGDRAIEGGDTASSAGAGAGSLAGAAASLAGAATTSIADSAAAASSGAQSPTNADSAAGASSSGTNTAGATTAETAGQAAGDAPTTTGADASPTTAAGADAAGSDASASAETSALAPAASAASTEASTPAAPPPATASGTQATPTTPASAPAPVAEPGMVDQLLASPYTMPGLAAVLVALGGYGWYTMRRRRKAEVFEDSLLAADAFTANSLFGTTGGQAVDTNSPSMFGPSVSDTVSDPHSTEVDPIAEAEVYIAYGRESQAEEILREALKRQPERQAIRLKLLEICAGRKDAAAFDVLAREMYEQTGGNNEEWPQVVTLGLALDPDNPLYSGGLDASTDLDAAPSAAIGDEPAHVADREGTIEQAFGQSEFGSDDREAPRPPALDADEDLAIGIPPPIPPQAEATTRVDPFAETQAMDDKPAGAPAAGAPAAGAPVDEEPLLDFSLDVDTALGRAADVQAGDGDAQANAGDAQTDLERAIGDRFELPSLDFADFGRSLADGQPAEAPSFEPVGEFALADDGVRDEGTPSFGEPGNLRIELPSLDDLNLKADGEIAAIADEIGALDLAELDGLPPAEGGSPAWQEMATKLDLASAYEEIGDRDGARELLEEVVRGGDGDQKRQAQAMLASIG